MKLATNIAMYFADIISPCIILSVGLDEEANAFIDRLINDT